MPLHVIAKMMFVMLVEDADIDDDFSTTRSSASAQQRLALRARPQRRQWACNTNIICELTHCDFGPGAKDGVIRCATTRASASAQNRFALRARPQRQQWACGEAAVNEDVGHAFPSEACALCKDAMSPRAAADRVFWAPWNR